MTLRVAIECGGTHSRAGLYSASGDCLRQIEAGGANPNDHGPAFTANRIVSMVRSLTPESTLVAAAIAGIRTADFVDRVARTAAIRLSGPAVAVTDDVAPVLHENLGERAGVLVIAGTGSCVMAQNRPGEIFRAGGRGPFFGDPGSAHQAAVAALRAAAGGIDGTAPVTALPRELAAAAGLREFEDFRQWGKLASKSAVAALAPCVSRLADSGDAAARQCLEAQAHQLAAQVFAATKRADLGQPQIVLYHGGFIRGAKIFLEAFRAIVSERWPSAPIEAARITGPEAVFRYANRYPEAASFTVVGPGQASEESQTEQRRFDETPLDRMTAYEMTTAMAADDMHAASASTQAVPQTAALIEAAAERFRRGGRIVYAGAGTSGRLGVLDASECYPTFGVARERVVGVMAGGDTAIRNSVEGTEDDERAAISDLQGLVPELRESDVFIGIAASGTTPYVRRAIGFARQRGALTALIACNAVPDSAADHVLFLDTGAEILPGSTRLKAGTATKMVLNQISTGVMALSGFVYEGFMVGVAPTNTKLRARAERILAHILGVDGESAALILNSAGGSIRAAVLMHRLGIDRSRAEIRLDQAKGSLRDALESV